jgi:hypothetical protein
VSCRTAPSHPSSRSDPATIPCACGEIAIASSSMGTQEKMLEHFPADGTPALEPPRSRPSRAELVVSAATTATLRELDELAECSFHPGAAARLADLATTALYHCQPLHNLDCLKRFRGVETNSARKRDSFQKIAAAPPPRGYEEAIARMRRVGSARLKPCQRVMVHCYVTTRCNIFSCRAESRGGCCGRGTEANIAWQTAGPVIHAPREDGVPHHIVVIIFSACASVEPGKLMSHSIHGMRWCVHASVYGFPSSRRSGRCCYIWRSASALARRA